MVHSIFHPSGHPSLIAVREWLSLMPNAVVIADVETSEVIAYSPVAKEMYGADDNGLYRAITTHLDKSDWSDALVRLESSDGRPLRFATTLRNFHGDTFPAICSINLRQIAGRRVFITTIEPGRHFQPDEKTRAKEALETIVHNQ